MPRIRSLTVLTAALVALAACGEPTTLPTTLEPLEMQEDVAISEAAFDYPATQALGDLGWAIDEALLAAGGLAVRIPAAMVREGPAAPMERHRDRIALMVTEDLAAAIPITLWGKTMVWDPVADYYIVSDLTGAPAGGVRFVLYEAEADSYFPVLPLVARGYADITRESSGNSLIARVAVYSLSDVKVMEYTASVGGTTTVPTFSVAGVAGVGTNRLTFSLDVGVNLLTGNVTTTWRTEIAARGLASRVQLGVGETSVTMGAVMQRSLRKVEMGGTLSIANGGTVTVKVGNRTFASIVIGGGENPTVTITDRNGAPLTAEEEDTLVAIFEWFSAAFDLPDALLAPVYTVLDVE